MRRKPKKPLSIRAEEFFHFMLLFKQRDGFSQKEAKSAFGSLCSFRLCWFMDSSDSLRSLRNMRMCFESSIVMSNRLTSDPRLAQAKAVLKLFQANLPEGLTISMCMSWETCCDFWASA